PEIHWSQLASFCGVSWAEWSVLSARRLDVESRTAAARMWAAWPLSWRSRTSVYAIDAAVKALASSGASWKEAGRDALHLLVEASPKDAQALGFAGAILIQTYDDHETGERLLDRAMAQTTDAETWGALGERLFEAARALAKRGPALLARAISCFERWVEASPMDAYARRRLADAQGELAARTWADAPDRAERLFTESEGQYKAALAIKPDMHEAENNWGSLLGDRAKLVEDRDAGRAGELYAAAEAHYRRAIELKPDMPEAEHNWGSVLKARAELVKGRDPTRAGELYAAAEAHYRRAIELKPDMPEAENNWGNVLVARAEFVKDRDPGRADELFAAAEVHYRRAIELKPDDHKAEYNWGSVLTRRAKLVKDRDAARADELFAAAEAHYRRAIELKPDDPNIEDPLIAALLWRSHILIAQERRAEASAMVEEALQRSRAVVERTGRPNYNLACALAQHGDVEQALETLEALEQRGELVELEWLLSDPDLAPLREYSGFGSLVERLRQATQKRVPAEPSTA
ncbi:MAG TPA: hypothetical protein VK459_21815, partial [Polyangiaceae bacterium]|nr:hypothetical protein [Polyangiaceae bacterium]